MYEVLMVDDEVIALKAMEKGVNWEKLGVGKTFAATNIQEAYSILNKENIDIAICDIEMPNGSGIELVEWIRGHNKNCICIFLTCHSDFVYAKQAITLGVLDYLLKPVDYQELEDVISIAIQKRRETLESDRAKALLSEVSQRVAPAKEEDKCKGIIMQAEQYIRENIARDFSVSEVAAHVCLNADYLSRIFKKETGYSLKEYILKMRMGVASELLAKTNLSVSKVAMSCGYSHMAHFSQMFKKENGMPPNEYRSKFR